LIRPIRPSPSTSRKPTGSIRLCRCPHRLPEPRPTLAATRHWSARWRSLSATWKPAIILTAARLLPCPNSSIPRRERQATGRSTMPR